MLHILRPGREKVFKANMWRKSSRSPKGTDCPLHLQDKLRQKQFFAAAGVPVPDFRGIEDASDLAAAAAEFGFPFMLKARR